MQTASINALKKELVNLSQAELVAYCMQLAKYKKENKELLSYLLFEANDEAAYIESAKQEIEVQFAEMNLSNTYLGKKTIRKVLRTTNKYAKYSGQKQTELELLIHFCKTLNTSGFPLQSSTAATNIYQRQLTKIQSILKTLHEDLQHDYKKEIVDIIKA